LVLRISKKLFCSKQINQHKELNYWLIPAKGWANFQTELVSGVIEAFEAISIDRFVQSILGCFIIFEYCNLRNHETF
jgi:hypothetical protein